MCLKYRNQATIDEPSIHQHGARATLPFSATFLRSGQPKMRSQNVQESFHRVCENSLRISPLTVSENERLSHCLSVITLVPPKGQPPAQPKH